MKANMKIREEARNSGVRLWQIADALGIQESMFSKKLRKELDYILDGYMQIIP